MVSDSDLVTRLREILRRSDLDTATAGSIRRQLEEDLSVDLSEKKKFIREQIDTFLETLNEGEGKSGNVSENENSKNDAVEGEENENDGVKEEEEEEETETKGSKGSNKTGKVRKRGGFAKLSSLSPQLQAVVGVPELARTEVVKKLWAYIREKNLQDPKNRKNIKCDEALRAVFCVNLIDMFQMNKALSKHIWPLTGEDEVEVFLMSECNFILKISPLKIMRWFTEVDDMRLFVISGPRLILGNVDENVKKRGGGFTKLCSLSPQLQEFVGAPELARTGVVKKLWAYIREMNLQDPKNKRNIICDESLRALFNVDSIDMFQMNKALSKHIWAVCEENGMHLMSFSCKFMFINIRIRIVGSASFDRPSIRVEKDTWLVYPLGSPSNSSSKEKGAKQGREEDPDEPKPKEKRQKKGASGLLAPLQISDALDPADKRRIICDDKLKELFEVDSFTGFTVSRLLSSHFIKTEQWWDELVCIFEFKNTECCSVENLQKKVPTGGFC
ncbi:hypothetical protein DKX38_006219 [Salix brachista]|uniref:DM2 domain-containing protein n=1 Tax=Salix brachista TaxID=2182728 RepID=A0A5N5N1W6_9ROSI|nr:hypothetical protein DKX38_006219 [Salix brachista]